MYMHLDDDSRFVFRTVRRGAAILEWRGRRVRLDADAYLVLAAGEHCLVRQEPGGGETTVVVISDADCAAARSGAKGDARLPLTLLRPGHLFAMNSSAGRRLSLIARARVAGRPPCEERDDRIALVGEAAAQHAALQLRAAQLGCVKAETREGLLRRVLTASDFIASHFDEPIGLTEMARAASLSRFHFVRLFRLLHGETPHAFLLRKRTAVARRRLAEGDDPDEAATRAGFGSRSSLFRNLRKPGPASIPDSTCCLFA